MADVPLGRDGIPHLIRNAEAGTAGSKDNHAEVLELLLADMETGHDGRQSHTAGALDVVIEAGKVRTVAVQKTSRCLHVSMYSACLGERNLTVVEAKVLKVDVCLWVQLPRRLDKGVDEPAVLFTPDTLLPEAQVQLVAEELLVVRPAIKDDGEGAVRMDASAESGEDQLGDRDEDASDALVADSQDLLAICVSP